LKTENKLHVIEWLRGLAALGVGVMHIFNASGFFTEQDLLFQKYLSPLTMIGRVGVAVFFVISGFVIPFSMWSNAYVFPKNWSNFMLRRIVRIEPPYVLSILAVLLCHFVIYELIRGTGYNFSILNILSHIGYLNIFTGQPWLQGVYWTLAVEFQYYLLISLLWSFFMHEKELWRFFSLLLLLPLAYLGENFLSSEAFIPKHVPLFVLGISTFLFYIKKLNRTFFLILFGIASVLVFKTFGVLYLISTVLTAALIFWNIDIKWRGIYFLGKISYSLYLMHWIFGVDISLNLLKYFHATDNTLLKIAYACVSLLMAIVLSYFYYLLIEKPAISWAKKLKKSVRD
jgi:peptidoglycan/LPS O-acetylase OafA/YrhL